MQTCSAISSVVEHPLIRRMSLLPNYPNLLRKRSGIDVHNKVLKGWNLNRKEFQNSDQSGAEINTPSNESWTPQVAKLKEIG